jgi:hypothetical protein
MLKYILRSLSVLRRHKRVLMYKDYAYSDKNIFINAAPYTHLQP